MTDKDQPSLKDRIRAELDQAQAENQSLGEMLERLNDQLYAFYNISKTIASTNDLPSMIADVVAVLRKAVPFDRAAFYLLDEDRGRLLPVYALGLALPPDLTIPIGEGLPGRIVQQGEHLHLHDIAAVPSSYGFLHHPGDGLRSGSYIGISLKSPDGETVGVLGMDSGRPQALGVEEMDFLALTSQQLSAGIEKCRLFRKAELLSRIDGLTGLLNRRVFDEVLLQELNRRSRTRKPLGLILLDIDHFKRFNDAFGHQEGDRVLRELADCIRRQCRHGTIDACCRYGGEEFAVILPEEGLPTTLMIAERIRSAVEAHPFSVKQDHPGAAVTVSLGAAAADPDEDIGPDALTKRADAALYAAKRAGRNRVSH